MKKLLLALFLFVPFLISAQNEGRTFYVALDGNDNNPGTKSEPFATWQRGFTATNLPGDTLFIRGGRYMSQMPVSYNPEGFPAPTGGIGTYENPIVIMGYPGEWPILDCSNHCDNIPHRPTGKRYNSGVGITNTEYIHFKDFEVCNVFQCDSTVDGAIGAAYSCNLTFEHIIVHDVGQRGFAVQGGVWTERDGPNQDIPIAPSKWGFGHPDTTRFINCDAYNLADSLVDAPGNAADGWKTIHYKDNVIIWEGCRAWNYTDDGFDPSGKQSKRIVRNCWAIPGDKYKNSISSDWNVERNGFKFSGPETGYDPNITYVDIQNCVSYDCSHGLILMEYGNNKKINAKVKNHTIIRCALGVANWSGDQYSNAPSTISYKNVLIHGTTGRNAIDKPYNTFIITDFPYNISHCTWRWSATEFQNIEPNPDYNVTDADFNSLDHAIILAELTAPRKPDGSLPDITSLQLKAGSELIDGGIDVGLPYYGSAPDLGAFEYIPKGTGMLEILDYSYNSSTKQVAVDYYSPQSTPIAITVQDSKGSQLVQTNHQALIGKDNQVDVNLDGLSPRIYTIRLSDGGSTASCVVNTEVGENSTINFKIVKSFPNPTDGLFAIQFFCLKKANVAVKVTDETGKTVLTDKFSAKPNLNKLVLNLVTFKTGIYKVSLNDGSNIINTTVTKQ